MAYWQGESEDRPAHIAFVDTHAGEVCRHEELTSGFWNGYAIWQDNGRVLAIFNQDKDVFRGTPCGVFDLVRDYAPSEEGGDVSPDSRYRADTLSKTEEQLIDRQSIYLFNLPDGELLGRWAASRFALIPADWSPDGKQLAALGRPLYDVREALFIIEP